MNKNIKAIITISVVLFTGLMFTSCAKKGPCLECAANQTGNKAEASPEKEKKWQELNSKVVELYNQGKLKEATVEANKTLKYAEKEFGNFSANVATSLNNLGELYRLQKKLPEAELNYKKSLDIREKTLGKEHLDVSLSLNNIATLYLFQGNYERAEPLYKRAVNIMGKNLGKDHISLQTPLTNLAELYNPYPDS